jgi:hypothetical protein
MEGLHLLFITFLDSLAIHYTTLKLPTYLEVALVITTYHHQDGEITSRRIGMILFDNGSMVDGRDPSIFINFPDSFPMNYTTLRLGLLIIVQSLG